MLRLAIRTGSWWRLAQAEVCIRFGVIFAACLAAIVLSGCASRKAPPPAQPPTTVSAAGAVRPLRMECVPFAREVSGIQLRGAAADWWPQADGRYTRSQVPEIGSVLVFQRTSRLPSGHVSVVSRVLSDRQIFVTHANWLRHHVIEDAPVVDISTANDWTLVRVWWPPTNQLGVTEYPTFGFIRPLPAGRPAV